MRVLCLGLAVLAFAGCASKASEKPRSAAAGAAPAAWRAIATQNDRKRLREWRTAWVEGLRKARASGHAAELEREGALLQPDAAGAWQDPPSGDYRCRVIKIGARSAGMLDYVSYPPFTCRIRAEVGMMSFAKMTGSQRPIGHLLPGTGNRMVFLGTLQLGDERRALQYGQDRERDMAGIVEHLGDGRWRLVLPYPHFESTIDVLELIPRSAAS